jgi:hypothetical protein
LSKIPLQFSGDGGVIKEGVIELDVFEPVIIPPPLNPNVVDLRINNDSDAI